MTEDPSASDGSESTIDENVRWQFEQAWHAGQPRPIDEFLSRIAAAHLLRTVEELVHVELELSWKRGQDPTGVEGKTKPVAARPCLLEAYLGRFPYLNVPSIIRRLAKQEYEVRHRYGDRPTAQLYLERFPKLGLTQAQMEQWAKSAGTQAPEPDSIPGYQILEVLGRGGHGDCLQGPAAQPQPRGRSEDDPD